MALAGTLEIQMMANMARLQADMTAAKNTVGGAMKSIESAVAMAKSALGALGLGLSVGALVAHARAIIDAADAMNDMAQRTGIAVAALAKYQLATAQSGTTMEALSKGVKGISVNLVEHGAALKAAGLSATNADDAMLQLADVFRYLPDGVQKADLAVKLFGKSGMDLIPMLNMGREGLKEAADKSAKYAAVMAALAPQADKFNDSMAELGMYTKIVGMNLVNDALPALNNIAKAFAEASQKGGLLSGMMAALSAGFDNYWANVRKIYGMQTPGSREASGKIIDGTSRFVGPPAPQEDKMMADAVAYAKRLRDALGGDKTGKAKGHTLQDDIAKSMQKEAMDIARDRAAARQSESDSIEAYMRDHTLAAMAAQHAMVETQKAAEAADAAQRDWRNGYTMALEEYQAKVANVAESTRNTMTDAFQGMEDALVNFVQTGKLDFSSLANSIIADMIRIMVQQQITKPLASMASDVFTLMVKGFDGGGYTGAGARSGGLDGKGGFMALMHPQETVIDHTKGQQAGQQVVTININATVGDVASKSDVVAGMRATASQIAASIARSQRYGGAMS